MKNILVPTDFSGISEHTAHYAAEIAKKSNAHITLLHVYQVPVVQAEVPVMIPTLSDIENVANEALVRLRAIIHTHHGPHIKVDHLVRCGFAVEEIKKHIQENPVDLVVMGMRGAGFAGEHLVGSVTTSLFHQLQIPVLAVNKDSEFKGLKKIVFAYDYIALENSKVLNIFTTLNDLFKPHIYILKVSSYEEAGKLPDVEEAVAGVRIDHLFEAYDHSFHFIANKDVVKGINEFVAEKDADLVVMIPHKKSFFQKLLHGSQTRHMAFHLKTPLLTLAQ